MAVTQLLFDLLAKDHASATFNKVGAAADQLGKRTDKAGRAHSAFGKAARWAGGMLATYGVARFAKESISASSNLNEALNATTVVFRKQSAEIKAWSEGAARDFGQSQSQALTTTRQFGTLLRSAGVGGKQLATYSSGLTELASDIASFNDVPVQQAITDMTSGLTGEVAPMRKYGVFLSAAALKAEAFSMGISDGTKTLTDQQRTLAAYNLILKQTGVTSDKFAKQYGDFDRTSGDYANQLRQAAANMEDFKAALGTAIVPLATKGLQAFNDAIPNMGAAIKRNLPQIQQTFDDAWRAGSKFAGAVKSIWDAFSAMPPGVRNAMMLLGGGAFAVGKIKGSAVGQGIGAMFSGIKTITAGNVTVVGKTVTGTPAAGGGGSTGGLWSKAAAGGAAASLGVTAIVTGITASIALAIKAGIDANYGSGVDGNRRFVRDTRTSTLGRGSDRGQGMGFDADGPKRYQSGIDSVIASQKRLTVETARWNAAAKSYADQQYIKKDQGRSLDAQAARYKALAKAVKDVPASKSTRVSAPGADQARSHVKGLGAAVGSLKGKTVKVAEAGADASKGRVKGLGGAIGNLKGKTVPIKADTSQAITGIGAVAQALTNLDGRVANTYVRQHNVKGAAGGGLIRGPGTSTSDSIDARLSDGEYVIRAAAVQHYGAGTFDRLNALRFAGGGKVSKDAAKEIKQARAEAARQARLAAQIDRKNLGQSAQDFLGGMSSKAALAALASMTKKELRNAAEKSGALGRLSTRRQNEADARAALQGLDADRASRRFGLLSPTDRKAEINAKITQNANAIALAKGQEKVRLIEKQRDLEQQLVDATEAEAQAAKDAADEQAAKEDAALEKVNALRDAVDQAAGSYRSFAGIGSTAVTDVADAQSKLTEATDAVAAAQKRMDLAGSDRERAAAAAELAKALRDQQAAQQGVSTSGKPTSGGIRANMATRLQKLKDFGATVKTLKAQGLNATTLSEILGMGPEQGYDFAKALLDGGGLAELNALQNEITATSADLGYFQYGTDAASASLTGYAAGQAAGLVANGVVMAPAPVTVSIDGNAIAQALISYKRQNGGSAPGLNL